MSYKITKSETKKIGTIKLPKGVWLHQDNNIIGISINLDINPYIKPDKILHNLVVLLSNYNPSRIECDIKIVFKLNSTLKIDYNCTKSDCTNEWTFYEKVEDTVKAQPNTPEETWAEAAYTFAKGKTYNPYK